MILVTLQIILVTVSNDPTDSTNDHSDNTNDRGVNINDPTDSTNDPADNTNDPIDITKFMQSTDTYRVCRHTFHQCLGAFRAFHRRLELSVQVYMVGLDLPRDARFRGQPTHKYTTGQLAVNPKAAGTENGTCKENSDIRMIL